MVYRRSWMVIFSGVFEPLFYLFSMGIGLGHFVGKVPGPGGRLVDYSSFIAPALLASAAMNGAIYDSTNVFWKLKYARTYDAVLSTPIGPADVAVGETAWALFRGFLYAISFMAVAGSLGLIESPWGLLALPGAVVIGFAFAGLGVAATTFMRSWQDFVLVALLTKRINDLTEHLRAHPKDHYSRRGLLKLVGRRRRFLTYLQKHDLEGYRALIKELGLRR